MNFRPRFHLSPELNRWLPAPGNILFTLLIAALLLYTQRANAFPHLTTPETSSASMTTLPYQGRVADSNGNPLTTIVAMTFNLYNGASGGSSLWSESWASVSVTEGLFNVLLGSVSPLPQTVFTENPSLWLGIKVGTDSEMTPRVHVGSVPYAMQALNVPEYSAYYPLYHPQTLDLTNINPDLRGYRNGFTNGQYAYLIPHYNGGWHGKVARVSLVDYPTGSVTVLDLATVDNDLRGFTSGFTDGRYGYFIPSFNGVYIGKVARIDLQNFSTGGVNILDLMEIDASLKGFQGGFTDGRYGYLVPFFDGNQYVGKAVRIDLQNFVNEGVTILDLTTVAPELKGFIGGFTDGQHGYFVPYSNAESQYSGRFVRVDLHNFMPSGVEILDLSLTDPTLIGFQEGFTDGRFGYLIPVFNGNYSGKVARIDLHNFSLDGVTSLDLTMVDPELKGFQGGFTDGTYGYFVPHSNSNGIFSGKVARVDLYNFTTRGVDALDFAAFDPSLKGFWGGFADGRYGYFVPYFNGSNYFGTLARIQLFSGNGTP